MDGPIPAFVIDTVPNPYFGPTSPEEHREIKVVRTLRNDPIGLMFAKGQIDLAQKSAARCWQKLAEEAGPSIKSSGHLQEPVDGGGQFRDGIVQRQIDAHKELVHFARLLGDRQHQLLVLVCEKGLAPWAATAVMFPDDVSHGRRRFVGTWFQEILSILARDMRLTS